jgi:hypothetical protein
MQRAGQPMKPHVHHGLPPASGPSMVSVMKGQGSSGPGGMGGVSAAYYPPPFQNHIEQLGKLTRPSFPFSLNRAMFVLD